MLWNEEGPNVRQPSWISLTLAALDSWPVSMVTSPAFPMRPILRDGFQPLPFPQYALYCPWCLWGSRFCKRMIPRQCLQIHEQEPLKILLSSSVVQCYIVDIRLFYIFFIKEYNATMLYHSFAQSITSKPIDVEELSLRVVVC